MTNKKCMGSPLFEILRNFRSFSGCGRGRGQTSDAPGTCIIIFMKFSEYLEILEYLNDPSKKNNPGLMLAA
jgi:hypothetical protein